MTINIGFDVKPLEAINYFKAKGLKATFSYADMLAADHVNNFTIAKMMDIDLLQDMYDSLLQAQKKGWTLQQWKERMIPHLQANGWWGRQAVVDPVTGKTILSELGSSRRLDIIFRTNMQMAYAAGHWQQIKEQERIAPYLMYNAVDDYRTREEHRANDNKIYPISHPFWVTHYPPNGFNCFLPDTKINGDLVGGIKHFYDGEAIEVTTASGRSLRVTANHPILTNRGWVIAKMINPADKLIAYDAPIESIHADSRSRQINNQKFIPTAENLFHSLLGNAFALAESPTLKLNDDFLSSYSEIHINVLNDGLLLKAKSKEGAGLKEQFFIFGSNGRGLGGLEANSTPNTNFAVSDFVNSQNSIDIALRISKLTSNGSFADIASGIHINNGPFKIIISFSSGLPSGTTLPFDGIGVLFNGLPLDQFSLRTTTQDNAIFSELSSNGCSADFGLFGYLLNAHATNVFIDPVINVRQFNFSGHVYDFQSSEGVLSANGILTHNCRCTTIQLSKSDLEDFGYEVSPDTEIKYKNWKNPRTGLIEKIPVGTDAGFNFNAGQARYEQLQQLAKEKAQAIKDKALKQAALDALDEMQNPLKADAAKGGIMSTQATINQQIVMPTLKQLNTPDVLKISEREALEQWASPNEIQKIEGYLLNDTDIAKNAKAYGLTIEEQIAIYYYTGYGSDLLNMMLNGESAFSVHIARVAILLNQALDKLPNHQGIVIRRERPKPLIMDTHFVGAVVTYHGFTSTTYGVEDVFPERKVRLVIHSKTGKNIHWLSLSKEFEDLAEYEVLLSQPKHFLVIDRYEVNDYIEIVLREIE